MDMQEPNKPGRVSFESLSQKAQQRALLVMRMHVMDSVRRRVEIGQREFINEIRTCTMVFVGFPSLKVRDCLACHGHFQLHCTSHLMLDMLSMPNGHLPCFYPDLVQAYM